MGRIFNHVRGLVAVFFCCCILCFASIASDSPVTVPSPQVFRIDPALGLELSAEWYKTTADGWTPVYLEIGGMTFPQWMDWEGRIVTYPSGDVPESQVLARLDLERDRLAVGDLELPLRLVAASDARVRAVVPGEWVDGRIRLRLERDTARVTLFGDRLRLGYLFLDRHRREKDGRSELLRAGPCSRDPLVLDAAAGVLRLKAPLAGQDGSRPLRTLAVREGARGSGTGDGAGTAADSPASSSGCLTIGQTADDPKIPIEEREALIALYTSTNGDAWRMKSGWKGMGENPDDFSNWGTECDWECVDCSADRLHVTSLHMEVNNMVGPLPSQISQLTMLQDLRMWGNFLTTLPAELGQLQWLQDLDLSENRIVSQIPAALGGMASLRRLNLSHSGAPDFPTGGLYGPIPSELGNLANLEDLDLRGNQLSGTLPAGLGNLGSLKWLDLSRNQLTGPLPASGIGWTQLREIHLQSNQLDGAIPAWLGELPSLTRLNLGQNRFSGGIPPTIGDLSHLEMLHLRGNELNGKIPDSLCNLTNLYWFDLSDNQLTDAIPHDIGNLTKLQYLYLSHNSLTGRIPYSVGKLAEIQPLDLSYNDLTGGWPVNIWEIPLTVFGVGHNPRLCESDVCCAVYDEGDGPEYYVPSCSLDLDRFGECCPLAKQSVGVTPDEFSKIDKALSGTTTVTINPLGEIDYHPDILKWSGKLTSERVQPAAPRPWGQLEELYLDHNRIHGQWQMDFSDMPALEVLGVNSNALRGTIPSSVPELAALRSLNVNDNGLTAGDGATAAVLAELNSFWSLSQTVPPTDVRVGSLSDTAVMVSWTPIEQWGNAGGYRVYYAAQPDGEWKLAGVTPDKSTDFFTVTNLIMGTTYLFAVQSWTEPNAANANRVESDWGVVVSAVPGVESVLLSGSVTDAVGWGVPGIGLSFSGTDLLAVTDAIGRWWQPVPMGWSGIVRPSLGRSAFQPETESFTNLTNDRTGVDFTLAVLTDDRAMGDLDDNGRTNVVDLSRLLHVFLYHFNQPSPGWVADFNDDGYISPDDVDLFRHYLADN